MVCSRARSGRTTCPECRTPCQVGAITTRRQNQFGQTSIAEGGPSDMIPYRPIVAFGPIPDNFEDDAIEFQRIVERIKGFMRRIRAGTLTANELMAAMHRELTTYQQECVWAELSKDVDMHQVILKMDQSKLIQYNQAAYFRSLIKHVLNKDDNSALAGRAVIGTVGIVADLAIEGISTNVFKYFAGADIISGAATFVVFSAIELSKWANDPTYTNQALAINCGEHAVGCTAGAVGAWAGFAGGVAAGAALAGGPLGVILGLLGMIGASFVADFGARKAYRKGIEVYAQKAEGDVEKEKRRLVGSMANSIGINLERDNFAAAKRIFREEILRTHPDKGSSEEDKNSRSERTMELISAWQIVRAYYKDVMHDSGLCETHGDAQDAREPESSVEVFCMKVKKHGSETWTTVRSWFGGRGNVQVGETETENGMERIERELIYL